jgi:cellulose synthase/poly-beta-1,6-N-acetylglucosamine synthase-like glycosyltransferase
VESYPIGQRRVLALIPAHNEADCIVRTLLSLHQQTHVPWRIVVVADNCTDDTAGVARPLAEIFETKGNTALKAGAINQALERFLPELEWTDGVLVMDADSILHPRFIEASLQQLGQVGELGVAAVGTVYHGRPDQSSVLSQLQRNEFRRCVRLARRSRTVTWCLSGVATLLRVDALLHVRAARLGGALPARTRPGVYSEDELTEDFEITLALRHLGYDCVAQSEYVSVSDVMPTWQKLWHQRVRWLRGALEGVAMYGWNRITLYYTVRLVWFYIGAVVTPLWLGLLAYTLATGTATWPLAWQAVTALFIFERVWTVRGEGPKGMLLAALFIPEFVYDSVLQALHLWTAFLCLRRAPRRWQPT